MITGIILASGFSNRMGCDKLLLELGEQTLIERVIESCKNSNLDSLVIVYRKEKIKEIAAKHNIKAILNSNASLGQSESIKLGVAGIKEKSDFMFIMGDQPFINRELINRLLREYRETDKNILVPYYNHKKGMPSIFGNRYKEELLNIRGDKGGRDLMDKYHMDLEKVYIEDKKAGKDIDTPEDLEVVKEWI